MSNLQGKKEDYILSLDNSCQLTKMDIVEQNLNAIDFGYELCKREYEEKLRWIPVEEKLPESHKVEVMFKTKKGEFYFGFYGLSCNFYAMLAGLLDKNIQVDNVTHWRLIL